MKKVISLLFLTCYALILNAQHITVMGIQLGQSEDVVRRALVQKGFTYKGPHNIFDTILFKGTFWNYENADISVDIEDGKATGLLVIPGFSYDQMSYYDDLVNNLESKYGKHQTLPFSYREHFGYFDGGCLWRVSGGYVAAYFAYAPNNRNKIIFHVYYLDNTNNYILLEKGKNRNTSNDL